MRYAYGITGALLLGGAAAAMTLQPPAGAQTAQNEPGTMQQVVPHPGAPMSFADMVARLLMTRSLAGTIGPNWTTLLRSCSAHEAYLRSVRALVSEERAAEFLLMDRLFPRSIAFNLERAERILSELEHESQRRTPADHARLALGRARTNLQYRPVREVLDDLPAQMLAVQQACAQASNLVRDRFFLPAITVWTQEAV